jgi:competence protein ComEA
MKNGTRVLVQSLIASLLPAAVWAGPVDVNSADAATLAEELDGIGPAKAEAIVDYRDRNGPFESVDELLDVKGIGERVLDMNQGNIRIEKSGRKSGSAKKPAGD